MIAMDIEFYQMEHGAHDILLLQEASIKVIVKIIDIM